jgi:hypothetical protein
MADLHNDQRGCCLCTRTQQACREYCASLAATPWLFLEYSWFRLREDGLDSSDSSPLGGPRVNATRQGTLKVSLWVPQALGEWLLGRRLPL